MLSPGGLSPKATAPSIWSLDSGYASNSLYTLSKEDLALTQPAFPEERQQAKRKEPAIDPIVTKLSVFTTKDTSDNDFLLPEFSSDGETCLTCEFWNITNPGENIRCEDCRIPEIVEPVSLLLANASPRGKQPISFFNRPKGTRRKKLELPHIPTRCSACELSVLIDPCGPSSCPSCSPNPDILSPITSTSSDYKIKRSRAGRNSKLPLSALNCLQAWLDANQDNPYPSAEVKRQLAQECGITEKQVTTWFTNARARQLSPLDTWLSSGSEDEGARESDIASAADIPGYELGFSYLSENRAPGYRRAGSVSGSSAFSAGQTRPQPSRRGKKKNYRRTNQPPQNTEITSPTLDTLVASQGCGDAQSDQDMWRCTFCRRQLVPKSWRRHEETQHRPKAQWTCMLYGPRVSFPSRSNSSSCCAFCMQKDPSDDHFLKNHRISECAKRPTGDRTFFRPDHLRQHVKNFHGARLFDIVQGRWKRAAEESVEGWTCGFCSERLETWDVRETHIANHFKEGLTMDQWHNYPEKEMKKNKVKTEKEKEKEEERQEKPPHGLARLSRTFTRRSTKRSEMPSSQTPFANSFDAVPTSGSVEFSSDHHDFSAPPVLPDINMDPLMDGYGNFVDWSQMADTHFTDTSVFDPALQADFDSALNMDGLEYGNIIHHQGPWGPS